MGQEEGGAYRNITMRNGDIDINPPLDACPPLPEITTSTATKLRPCRCAEHLTFKGVPNAQRMAMDFSKDDWRQYRWAYHRLVELVDEQIARALGALEDNNLADNTVVIFTSDHGDGYAAHRWHQKSVPYHDLREWLKRTDDTYREN